MNKFKNWLFKKNNTVDKPLTKITGKEIIIKNNTRMRNWIQIAEIKEPISVKIRYHLLN